MTGRSYAWEKLNLAVRILATGAGPLSERLQHAYVPALMTLAPTDFPDLETRERFVALTTKMAPASGGELTFAEKADEELQRLAESIVDLHDAVVSPRD